FVSGSGASVTVGANSLVTFNGTDTVSANYAQLLLTSGALTVTGTGDAISLNSLGETLTLTQTGATASITVAGGTTAAGAAAAPDVINASGDTLSISTPGDNQRAFFNFITVNGSSDTLSLGASAFVYTTVQLNGNNDALSFINVNGSPT